ncbi:beta-galactosidase family protein [Paenibacillus illinoisensis]|uniref:glycoside hydrolase family 35 protein n=1 Tax=Paenibacillus illinoisensis TaxID=59845 RepID=UPI001C8D20BD|nr:beta-galactosidase family protein [Paenibacillus illinoisensis]MBY0216947.1 beta-galactosidase [Paenibacillus illinoisensis]
MAVLTYQGSQFMYDNKPVQILSGAIHYFRVVPEYWEDRLLKLKACGFNTVETYVPWNFHEPQPGQYRFEGMADLERFIQIAADVGLYVIIRPSPYICAEWEFGGLPSWLLSDDAIRLRCNDEQFLANVDRYYDVLLPKLQPFLSTRGGPIIAMQIENEYGSFGNDASYLIYLRDGMVRRGIDVLLFTSDGPTDHMLQAGSVPGHLATVNFGSGTQGAFAKLRTYQAEEPLMCMEYWNGWFDHWGESHHTRDAEDVAGVFEEMLQEGASVNFYMFHGGTNFGFYNGANCQQKNQYEPTITSYDYDSLLSESGEPTAKFHAVRELIARYSGRDMGELVLPESKGTFAYGQVKLTEQAELLKQVDNISVPVQRTNPEPMEKLGQDYGFILYQTRISGPRERQELVVQEVHDRALVFVDGQFQGVLERGNDALSVSFEVPAEGANLSILVENMGRINYGPYLRDPKGITEGVRHGFQFLFDWTIHCMPLTELSGLQFGERSTNMEGPAFYRGNFQVNEAQDTFLRLDHWTKGVVCVNGFNLGRYWDKGPQKTLYVPAPLLRQGVNEIIVFELHKTTDQAVTFVNKADLG